MFLHCKAPYMHYSIYSSPQLYKIGIIILFNSENQKWRINLLDLKYMPIYIVEPE